MYMFGPYLELFQGAKSTVVQNVAINLPDLEAGKQDGEVGKVGTSRDNNISIISGNYIISDHVITCIFQRKYRLTENGARSLLRASLAEILGTFLLILVCVGSANSRILESLAPETTTINFPVTYYLTIAFAFGLGK